MDEERVREAGKAVWKLLATGLENPTDPAVASQFIQSVDRLVSTIFTEDELSQIAEDLICPKKS